MSKRIGIAAGSLALLGGIALTVYFSTRPAPVPAPLADPWFVDATEESGITFLHDAGKARDHWMPRINGSGVAVFDFDGDEKPDILFLNFGGAESGSTNRLYRNLGGGKFVDATAGSGLECPGHNTGVIAGDVDNDGRPDLVVSQYNGVRLFRNLGGGKFADVTAASGLKNPLWATSANLFDYDRDGWLDLVIVNYVDYSSGLNCPDQSGRPDYCSPLQFPPTVSKLFHNLGRPAGASAGQPRFQDVTVAAGLAAKPGPGLGVYCADFDGDGWQDIFIANDLKPNHLWMNQRNGTFKEEAFLRGIAMDSMGQAQSGMGVGAGDVDNDGLFDIYVTHLTSERNTLWMQGPGRGRFTDRTSQTGLAGTGWRGTGWGTSIADFDGDGWPDIAVANGRVSRGTGMPAPALGEQFEHYGERNQLFRNSGNGLFADVSESNPAFCGEPNTGRGLAVADLDGDGMLDLVLTTIANRGRVYRNVVKPANWLVVRAFDPRLSRDAYGAEVRLAAGGRSLFRIVNPGDSFQSSSDPRVHFGLGESSLFDSVEILWPDGLKETFQGGAANRVLSLRRGEGRIIGKP